MIILFHCWEYPPRGSGIGRYVFHMSAALRQAGHFTVIVTSHGDEGPSQECMDNGVLYREYGLKDIGDPKISEIVLEKAKQHAVDWIEGVDHLGESAHLLSIKERPPVVIKAHYNDVLKVSRYAQVYYPWQKKMVDLACFRDRKRLLRERISLHHADLLIAPSERIILEMKQQDFSLAITQGVIANPIPPLPKWENQEAEVPTLLLVGRIDIGKGIEFLPKLVSELAPNFPNLRVEIAGGDSYARFLGSTKKWLVNQLGKNRDRIVFLGSLSPEALDEAYSRAWVVIVPSKWDTFPTVVLEAMVRGKALVASFHGGMVEMLGKTSCKIADPSNSTFVEAVAAFLSDKKQREAAGLSGLARAKKKYSPEKIAALYIQLLESRK
ncbi:MAG: glycosyltransferase involved in cell wall biosynthesis [Desulforhopalus sp.]|jgi:glycosyltransferase involved in cell wall biosynthesis